MITSATEVTCIVTKLFSAARNIKVMKMKKFWAYLLNRPCKGLNKRINFLLTQEKRDTEIGSITCYIIQMYLYRPAGHGTMNLVYPLFK